MNNMYMNYGRKGIKHKLVSNNAVNIIILTGL